MKNELRCSICQEWKPESQFSRNRSRKNGRANNCKTCQSKQEKKSRDENREAYRTYMREYMRSYKPKKPEPAQPSLFDQPDNRPRCTCGKPLYHGVCLVCTPKQIQAARMSAALQTVARAMAG